MKITELEDFIETADACGHVPLIRSLHGVGKSASCAEYAKKNNLHYEPLILSLMDTGDMLGLPSMTETSGMAATTWAAPTWYTNIVNAAWPKELGFERLQFTDEDFQQYVTSNMETSIITREALNNLFCSYYKVPNDKFQLLRQSKVHHLDAKRSLLFLDEFNRAPKDILDASLQLILDHRLHSHILPVIRGQETLIVAAINPANGDYGVQEFDPALLDRFVDCDVEPDFQAWYTYTKKVKGNKIVLDFLTDNQNKLHFTPKDNTKGASPRSWSRLGTYMDHVQKTQQPISLDYIKGTVGSALAAQFISFFNNYSTTLSFTDLDGLIKQKLTALGDDDIITVSKTITEEVAALDAVKRSEFAESFANAYSEKTNIKEALPWLVYLHALPLESLSAVLKIMQAESIDTFVAFVGFDKETTNKALLKKLTGKLKRDSF